MALHKLVTPVTDVLPIPEELPAIRDRRRRLLASARGRVLEIGGSGGRNAEHYVAGQVDLVVTLAPKASQRSKLMGRVAQSPVKVEVHEAVVEDVAFDDGWFDTVVTTTALCCVPDLATTLAAARRMLDAEGSLLLLEHTRVGGVAGAVQRATAPVWHRAGGCRLDRDVLAAVRAAGFVVTDVDRFRPLPVPLSPVTWVEAVARPARPRPVAATAAGDVVEETA